MPKTCLVDDCTSAAARRGLCNRHYLRMRRHGTPTAGACARNPNPPATCTHPGCDAPHDSLGLCGAHAARQRRHGDASVTVCFRDPRASFAARTQPAAGGCIEWTGAIAPTGYGVMTIRRRTIGAHRFAFEQRHGRSVVAGMHVHHTCRNRRCVNADHLVEIDGAEHTLLHHREDARRQRCA